MSGKNLASLFTVPNLFSYSRIFITPISCYYLYQQQFKIALILVIYAGFTDWIDGWSARFCNQESDLGRLLDPLADKILVGSIYYTLGLLNYFPWWIVVATLLRDILLVIGSFMILSLKVPFNLKPTLVSKLNTFLQLILVMFTLCLLSFLQNNPFLTSLQKPFFYVVFTTISISFFQYVYFFTKAIIHDSKKH